MFGYINVDEAQLNDDSKEHYKAFYCGLCDVLRRNCGIKGRMLVNFDMTFLIILLSGLYELNNDEIMYHCPIHPAKKRKIWVNDATNYAADMNVLFAYQNFKDDYKDNRSYSRHMLTRIFDKDYERIRSKYKRQSKAIEDYIDKLDKAESNNETNIDYISSFTADMLSEIFVYRQDDIWAKDLKIMGYYMGKFIYLMDAFDDVEKDIKNNDFNPLINLFNENKKDFDMLCRLMLSSMMSECSKAFERLPILMYVDILRNILYCGVWSRFKIRTNKRKGEI